MSGAILSLTIGLAMIVWAASAGGQTTPPEALRCAERIALFDGRAVDRFVSELKPLQDALCDYQDAAAGRLLWREQTAQDPGAWFGAGWLAAREEHLAEHCGKACRRTAKVLHPFW